MAAARADPQDHGRVSETLRQRAEILKLARLLDCAPERLSYLEQAPPGEIRILREQVTDLLFTAHEATFKRLAAASRLLPVSLVAIMGRQAFGPVLAARITGLLDPARAIEMAQTMPISFLADVAAEIDPRRATAVISGMPPARMEDVTRELARRHEYVTMGRFVGHLSPEALQAAVGVMGNGDLLRTAFVMEEKERLDDLVELMGEDRLKHLVEAAGEENLWDELTDLAGHLSQQRRAALAHRARETGFYEKLGPLAAVLSAD